ncbi:MAG: hypothetical protein JRD92_10320 [Deltaproteobacteria bacterium]|nr:hypothetical protein [Deltaproteobacteria bacterium]
MPVARMTSGTALWCALLLVLLGGCRNEEPVCPEASVTADPVQIPNGVNHTDLLVEVSDPFPLTGREVLTELTTINGVIDDPFARATTYSCAHDVSGEVEICVNAIYGGGDVESGSEDPNVGAVSENLRTPHVRIRDPLECSSTQCTIVVCPEVKNECPVVSSLTVEPMVVPEGGTATIEVVAEDPDDNPEALVTTLSARHGTIADLNALQATYTCDPEVGGAIEICVVASDGDSTCDAEVCTSVRCPGDPLENTCPIIEDFAANPNPIPAGEDTTIVRVDAVDPDEFPQPLRTELSSPTGAFADKSASETLFRCGEPGPVEISVKATDGDTACDETRNITIQCPSDIRPNLCPMLFVINAFPREIPLGENSTRLETRGQDTDGLPLPLVLTLNALWGSFENTVNIQEPNNVVAQNATYVCDRPGEVEVCVDATDGACVKTLCDFIMCPSDIPTP